MKLRRSALMAIGCLLFVVPARGASQALPQISDILERNSALLESIKSGRIVMESRIEDYPTQAEVDAEFLAQKSTYEQDLRDLETRSDLSPGDREMNIKAVTRVRDSMLSKIRQKDKVDHRQIDITFDVTTKSYRRDDMPLGSPSESSREPAITSSELKSTRVMKSGDMVSYYPDKRYAIVKHNAGSVPNDLQIYLGILEPKRLRELPPEVEAVETSIDGANVLMYTLREPGKADSLSILVDPTIGYRYRRIDFERDGKIIRQIEAKDYEMFGDVPFPRLWSDTTFRADGDRVIEKKETINTLEANFNQDIAPSVFDLQFPPGTAIQDLQLNITLNSSGDYGTPMPGQAKPMSVEEIMDSVNEAKNAESGSTDPAGNLAIPVPIPPVGASLEPTRSIRSSVVFTIATLAVLAAGFLIWRISRKRPTQ